jgi:tetraacyldisaccharide 4'-kinase
MNNKHRLIYLLYPVLILISAFYYFITQIRNFLFDINLIKSKKIDLPVISLGNITAGGTGKTPHTELLLRLLSKKYNIAVISRGYRRKTKGLLIADENSSASDIGDEPRQIKQKFRNIIIAVDKNRINAISKIKKLFPEINLFILDDAFQYRFIKPAISILLIDYNFPIYKDYIIPLGKLRESTRQIKRADLIIFTKCPENINNKDIDLMVKKLKILPDQKYYFSKIEYSNILNPVFYGFNNIQVSYLKEHKIGIILLTGIANYRQILQFIKNNFILIKHFIYPDHYYYTKKDLENIYNYISNNEISEYIILTSEKDSVRIALIEDLPVKMKEKIFYIEIEINILFNKTDEFKELIIKKL